MADKSCFVVMGYGQRRDPISGKKVDLNKIYFEIIKPIAIECGYNCYRGDEIPDSGIIDVSMYYGILDADLVIADITTLNPNAIYELGVRHGVRKRKTIVMMEQSNKFFFDLNHIRTLLYKYHTRGKVWDSEADKVRSALKERIEYLDQQDEKDSPLDTFIEDLCEPQKHSKQSFNGEKGIPLYERVRAAINARRSKQYQIALKLFGDLNEQYPTDSFFIQQKAICTYKLQQPTEEMSYIEALNILKPISKSIDPETKGLIASIHKRLFILQGDMTHLDTAIEELEKAYGLYHGYYNGDNLAYCLNLKASVVEDEEEREELNIEARRIRKEIINKNKDIVVEEIDTEEEIWMISTLAICYFALNKKEEATKCESLFLSKADRDMKKSYLEQKERMFKLLNIN